MNQHKEKLHQKLTSAIAKINNIVQYGGLKKQYQDELERLEKILIALHEIKQSITKDEESQNGG